MEHGVCLVCIMTGHLYATCGALATESYRVYVPELDCGDQMGLFFEITLIPCRTSGENPAFPTK